MFRRSKQANAQQTRADHRPMLPELREPKDPLDAAIRSAHREDRLLDPREYTNWR